MITNELIERINFLAKKKKEVGLTPEEEQEQKEVRRQYIDGIKDQLRPMLAELKKGKTDDSVYHQAGCDCGRCKH
ncbi:DUF896 domain-containing protein [Candidatus Formimonas warabiya]|uniref:UPF0291 protein DCMF_01680 n=1 Tax=Formimonas warabiya TaxID=1761012 RepID=A0A3G1KMI6_FORW1|nr:DUF896 domain-containing protein [Candidatus Formimonas warabiya]ATW23673.1 hypothetical protein DCMF_01680 [Candidatus Formimonas warabiya]